MVPKKRKNDVDKLERVQKRATKLIPELSKKSYSDRRLKALKSPRLKYRRYRGDMISIYFAHPQRSIVEICYSVF